MAAKHMKLLLAALALLLATATTLAHAKCSTIPNCDSCSTPTKCDSCKGGYSPAFENQSYCTSLCQATNCQECSTSAWSKCGTCLPDYTLNADGKCVPSPCGINNCKACASATTCGTCVDGYDLQSDKASCAINGSYCFVPNCAKCDGDFYNDVICLACSEGYRLAENSTLCSGAVTPAGAATAAIAALALAVAALAL